MTTIGSMMPLVDAIGPASVRPASSFATGESGFDTILARVLDQPDRTADEPSGRERAESLSEPAAEVGEHRRPAESGEPLRDAADPVERAEPGPSEPSLVPVVPLPVATELAAAPVHLSPSLPGGHAAAADTPTSPGVAAAAATSPIAAADGDTATTPGVLVGPSTATAVQPGVAVPGQPLAGELSTEPVVGGASIDIAATSPAASTSTATTGGDPTGSAAPAEPVLVGSASPGPAEELAITVPGVGHEAGSQEGQGQATPTSMSSGDLSSTAGAAVAPSVSVDQAPAAASADGAGAPGGPGGDIRPGAVTTNGASSTTAPVVGRAEAPGAPSPEPALQQGLAGSRLRDRFVGTGLGGTMTMDLSDEGLGQLSLRAQQSGNGLHVTLAAAESSTRELLLSQSANLRSELESVGPLGSLDVTDSLSTGGGGRGAAGDGRAAWTGDRSGHADQRLRNDQPGSDATLRPAASGPQPSTARTAGSTGLDLLI